MNVGDRILIEEDEETCCGDALFECEIIEVSPTQLAVKVLITDENRIYKKWYKMENILETLESR
jgi:hypothetical protein